MDTPLTAFVVDVGSLSVRCGYSGDDTPRQLHASCVGIQSSSFTTTSSLSSSCLSETSPLCASSAALPAADETGVLLFPLTFSDKRRQLAVQPCLYPTFSSVGCPGKSSQPSYILHEEVFEALMTCCIEGQLSMSSGAGLHCYDEPGAADDEEDDDSTPCPIHSVSTFCGSASSTPPRVSSSSPVASHSSHAFGATGDDSETHMNHSSSSSKSTSSSSSSTAAAGGRDCSCRRRRRIKGHFAGREWRPTELCGLGESLCDYPLLLSEPNLHCRDLREKLVEIAFERLASPAVYVAPRAQLSCLSLGRSSGMVVDIGAAATSIAPVIDGFVLHQEVGEWPAGGNLLDQLLACALQRHRLPLLPLFSSHKKYACGVSQQQQQRAAAAAAAHHHTAAAGTGTGGTTTAAGTGAAATGGGSTYNSNNSSKYSYYDWSNVHSTYLQRSQCAALRAMKEGFFRVHAGGHRAAADDAAAAASSKEAGETDGAAGRQQQQQGQQQTRTIGPLAFPPPITAASTQKKELLHPISSRYISLLPLPQQQRSGPHAAARDRSSNPTAAAALAAGSSALELPDGTLLAADELATAIPEVLFRPQEMLQHLQEEPWLQEAAVRSFKGIGQSLREVAARVDSLESRREILNGIVLTGGCSAMPGLYERLNAELQNEPSLTHGLRWRLLAAPGAIERKFSSWIGGSILSSMGAFQSMWCSREEYAEHGPSIVERKCY